VHYLCRIVRNPDIAEDLAQEVFLRVHRNRHRYRATAKFTTWLHQIAGNLALNWLRDHPRHRRWIELDGLAGSVSPKQFADPGPRADERLILERKRRDVQAAIAELPDRQRAALLLHRFQGDGCEQIAARMGCTHQAVRSLLVRAYATLRVRLQ
jgi:RNA polymerase sigma-70 factor (ECF subfamily)